MTITTDTPAMSPHAVALLCEAFPKSAISKLPKGGTMLDFVGHAAVTRRLLEVDPSWNWEPVAFDETGLPKFDDRGGLWIRLTICGVTRLGYGEPQGSDAFDKTKGAIGNAVRNAAMRFGVALDLWSKDDISTTLAAVAPEGTEPRTEAVARVMESLGGDAKAAGAAWTQAGLPGKDAEFVSKEDVNRAIAAALASTEDKPF